jgi:hypothetical protein
MAASVGVPARRQPRAASPVEQRGDRRGADARLISEHQDQHL